MIRKFKQNDNNLAIAYYRFSSDAQSDASIKQQREAAEKYAKDNGWKIIREYQDEAISGTESERPGFCALLNEVGTLRPAVLIVWKLDRLSRDFYDTFDAFKQFENAGCTVCSVTEPYLQSSDDKLLKAMLAYQAEKYVLNLSDNIHRGQRDVANNALYAGYKILGYKAVPAPEYGTHRQKYAIDPDNAPVVLRIFRDYAQGKPMKQICSELNSEGFKTVKNAKFTINSLRFILQNKAYIGEYKYKGVTVKGGMPVIISEELFDKAQKMLVKNKRTASQNADRGEEAPRYWLTGKLFCGYCEASMQGMSGTSKTGKIHYYYACKNSRAHKCKMRPVKKDVVESFVLDTMSLILKTSGAVEQLALELAEDAKKRTENNRDIIESLKSRKADAQRKLNNITEAITNGIWNDMTQAKMLELQKEVKDLSDSIEFEEAAAALAADKVSVNNFFAQYKDKNIDDPVIRDYVFDSLIEKILVDEEGVAIVCNLEFNCPQDYNRVIELRFDQEKANEGILEGVFMEHTGIFDEYLESLSYQDIMGHDFYDNCSYSEDDDDDDPNDPKGGGKRRRKKKDDNSGQGESAKCSKTQGKNSSNSSCCAP